MEIFASLNQNLVKWAVSRYEASPDPSHGMQHILEVAHAARAISRAYDLDPEPMLLAALLHDVMSHVDREQHHVLASDWVLDHLGEYGYDAGLTSRVARMCLEHRASGKDLYPDIYCEAFSAADRGPLTIEGFVRRMLKWPRDRDNQARLEEEVSHTKEKHSRGKGYARPNQVHAEFYASSLDKFYQDVESLTVAKVLEIMGG